MSTLTGFKFRKHQRLLSSKDFKQAFDNVQCRQGGKFCTLLSAPSETSHTKLGTIAAKRNLRLAVQRNHFKRLVRETFRLQGPAFNQLNQRFDIIAIAKPAASTASDSALNNELLRQWPKLIDKLSKLER